MNINKKFIVCDIKVLRTFFVAKAYLAILNCVIALRHVFPLSMAFVIRNYAITMRVLFLISEIRNPQGHFSAFKQERNGRPDGAPVKLHDVFLYTVVKNEKRRPGKREHHRALQTWIQVNYLGSVPNHFL